MKIGVDYIGVSAGAVIFKEDKVFMALRGPNARDDKGKWEFPGGSINLFETRDKAARRNIFDKYNIKFEVISLLGIYDVIDKENNDHWLSTTFIGKYISGEPKINFLDKCEDIGWFTLEEVREMNVSRITKLNLESLSKLEIV